MEKNPIKLADIRSASSGTDLVRCFLLHAYGRSELCLLYTSDAADEL